MAHFLKKSGWTVHLYESAHRIGGKIQSHEIPEGVYEEGPNALYATEEVELWLKELCLEILPATSKLKRRIWRGSPQAPLNPKDVLKLLPRLFKHSPNLDTDQTLADFFRPLLQDKIESLLTPALQGVYGVGADQLSVKSIWPELRAGTYFSIFRQLKGPRARSLSFKNGMQEFIDRLAQDLKVNLDQKEFILRPNTIICTEAFAAAELLKNSHNDWTHELLKIEYNSLSSVVALVEPKDEMKKTFGFLFPRNSGIHSLGVLFNKEIFSKRCGATFIVANSQDALSLIQSDLTRLNWKADKVFVHSWNRALPLYNGQRYEAIQALHTIGSKIQGLVIFGNYVAGISLRDMISAAKHFSEEQKRIS